MMWIGLTQEASDIMTSATDRARSAADTLEGLFNARDPRVVEREIAAPYYQHNPLIPNGTEPIAGFVGSLGGVTEPIIEVARAVAEGDFAAVHSHYAWSPTFELDGGRGSAVVDIFRNGPDCKIVEHWDVAQAIPETTANGNTMLDGGGDPDAAADIEANKAVVRRLFEVFRSDDPAGFDQLIVPDYIQHNPQVPNGLDAVKAFFGGLGPVDVELVRLIAQGDLVFAHSNYGTFKSAVVDIFRLADGRIVEHWDVIQPIPETTASGNDMFRQLS